jgi:hypothetical protein
MSNDEEISVTVTMLQPPLPDGARTLTFVGDDRILAVSEEDWQKIKPLAQNQRELLVSVKEDGTAVITGKPPPLIEGDHAIKKSRSLLTSVLVTPLKKMMPGAVTLGMRGGAGEDEEVLLSPADAEKVRRLMLFKREGQRMSTMEEGDQIRIMLE